MSGFFGDLSVQQAEALAKLKAAMADVPDLPENTDQYYLRWLRARKFNVDKAQQMLRNHLVYRKERNVDRILEDWTPPKVLEECFPKGCFGEDRQGHPVWHFSIGNIDPKGYMKSVTPDQILKYITRSLEVINNLVKDTSKTKGRQIESLTLLVDTEKLSFQKHYHWPAIQVFRQGLSVMEANYPEILHHVLVVKAPKVFPLFYNLIKHFLDKRTRDKVVVMSNSDGWKAELQKYISPDQLPQAFGGTRCEPDPGCTDHINPGYDVPPKYYLTNLTETDRREMDRVVVGRGGSCELEYEVEAEGSLIRWEFVSTSYNISYGLFYKEATDAKKKPKLVPVVPVKKAESHIVPETGTHTCTTSGKYVFKFDNSYSWTRSKEVFYSIQVLPPDTNPDLPDVSGGGSQDCDGEAVGGVESITTATGENSDDEFYECENDTSTTTS